jgi:hypothetical protein
MSKSHDGAWKITALLLLSSGLAGCAAVSTTPTPQPVERERGFPGFDISAYPGDEVMRAWRRPGSPYHWVGYYLPAPCRRDTSWAGRRATLESMGWGFAVLYVGQQTWDNVRDVEAPATDTLAVDTVQADTAAAATEVACSRTLLSAERGAQEADDAVARAVAEGFPRGTTIFLNIERMEQVTPSMRDYYRAWTRRVLQDGRFRPGVYAHHRNAAEIRTDILEVHASAGRAGSPPLWIANPAGFSLAAAPHESGHGPATVWQGALDVQRRWNGHTLTIDENVADAPSPSASPAMFPSDADRGSECSTDSCTRVATTATSRR